LIPPLLTHRVPDQVPNWTSKGKVPSEKGTPPPVCQRQSQGTPYILEIIIIFGRKNSPLSSPLFRDFGVQRPVCSPIYHALGFMRTKKAQFIYLNFIGVEFSSNFIHFLMMRLHPLVCSHDRRRKFLILPSVVKIFCVKANKFTLTISSSLPNGDGKLGRKLRKMSLSGNTKCFFWTNTHPPYMTPPYMTPRSEGPRKTILAFMFCVGHHI